MNKTELLLVTGFLGAGKTTFLKEFIKRFQHKRLHVIVNEFGKTGVDGLLLQDLGAAVKEISGGSVFCACKLEEFEAALKEALQSEPDMILVEASGLSDPSAIRQTIAQFSQIDYTGCVAVTDAVRVTKLLSTARMAMKQLAVADLILLNKMDLSESKTLEDTQAMLRDRFPHAALHLTTHGAFESAWLDSLKTSNPTDSPIGGHTRDITLQKASITLSEAMTSVQLKQFLKLFAEDTHRIKGLVRLKDGAFQIDGIGAAMEQRPYTGPLPAEGNQITALAGAGMALLKSLQKARAWYPDLVTHIE